MGTSVFIRLFTFQEEIYLIQWIREKVNDLAPEGFSFMDQWFLRTKQKWQKRLAPGLQIPLSDTFDERLWPPLANQLIANLIVRDLIYIAINQLLLSTGSGGEVRSVKTGPTEVEYQGSDESLKSFVSSDGIPRLYRAEVCGLASSLGIHLKDCKGKNVRIPKVLYNKNPLKWQR
jgi:hypothetical protein